MWKYKLAVVFNVERQERTVRSFETKICFWVGRGGGEGGGTLLEFSIRLCCVSISVSFRLSWNVEHAHVSVEIWILQKWWTYICSLLERLHVNSCDCDEGVPKQNSLFSYRIGKLLSRCGVKPQTYLENDIGFPLYVGRVHYVISTKYWTLCFVQNNIRLFLNSHSQDEESSKQNHPDTPQDEQTYTRLHYHDSTLAASPSVATCPRQGII